MLTHKQFAALTIAPGNRRTGISEAELDARLMDQAEGEGMYCGPHELQERILTAYLGSPDDQWNADSAALAMAGA